MFILIAGLVILLLHQTMPSLEMESGDSYIANETLSRIPDDVPHNISSLTMSPNAMKSLKAHQFQNFTSLTYLDLSLGNISWIEPGSFTGLGILKNLSLWDNEVSYVSNQTWAGLLSLKVLDLGYNHLRTVEYDMWITFQTLEELYLDHNDITTVGNSAFRDLSNLKILHLHNNKLTTFIVSDFRRENNNHSLVLEITLSENPLQDDHDNCTAIDRAVHKSNRVTWARTARTRPGLQLTEPDWIPDHLCVVPGTVLKRLTALYSQANKLC